MEECSVRKKFNTVSATGLGVAKNGKFQYPFKFLGGQIQSDEGDCGLNSYGQTWPKPGDFCAYALPSGILSAGTVGRIMSEDFTGCTVQFLDGRLERGWRYATGLLTEAQAKEVRDYYVKTENRPDRIRHDFWPGS